MASSEPAKRKRLTNLEHWAILGSPGVEPSSSACRSLYRTEANVSSFGMPTAFLGEETRILAVEGVIDLFSAPQFEEELVVAIQSGPASLIVDLTDCGFLDSGALSVIMLRNKLLDSDGPRLLLVLPHRNLVRVFAMTELSRVFEIYPTRAEAVAHAATRAGQDTPSASAVRAPRGSRSLAPTHQPLR